MTRVSNMVLNGEITPQQANALIYAGNAVLSSIRADEQERRLTELERKLMNWKEWQTMSNRIDRLEARVQALSAQTAPVVLLIETENGSQRMTVSQYNAAGGMLAMPIWKNPEALNLRAARGSCLQPCPARLNNFFTR